MTLPFNESEALIDVGEPGAYQFRIVCNSTIGETDFSSPVTAQVQEADGCTGSGLECNPVYIYAIIIPIAGLVGIAAMVAVIFVIVKAATRKPTP